MGPFFSKPQSVIHLGRLDLGLGFRLMTDLACLHFLPKMLWREVGRSAWVVESQKDPSDCWVSSIHSEKPPTRFIVYLEECLLRRRTHGHHGIPFLNLKNCQFLCHVAASTVDSLVQALIPIMPMALSITQHQYTGHHTKLLYHAWPWWVLQWRMKEATIRLLCHAELYPQPHQNHKNISTSYFEPACNPPLFITTSIL